MDQQGFAESSSTTSQHILPVSNFFCSKKPHKKPCRFCHFDHDKRKRWGPKTSPTRNPKRSEALADALPGWIPLRQQEAHHTNGPRWGMSWLAPHGVKQHLEDWDLQPPLEVICRPCNQIWGSPGCPRNFFHILSATSSGLNKNPGLTSFFWLVRNVMKELDLIDVNINAPTYLPTYTYTHISGKSSNCLWANPQILKAEAYGHDATGAGTLTSGNVFFFAFLLLEKNSDDFDWTGWTSDKTPIHLTQFMCLIFLVPKKVTAMHPHCW